METEKVAQHSPAPWGLEGTEGFGFAIRGPAPGRPLADNIPTLADARLMRAAPELLEALEEMLLGGQHEGSCTNEGLEREEACELHLQATVVRENMARAALTKARR